MKCPRCVQRIHRAAEVCPHCGFSIADADQRYGRDEWRLRRLTDAAGVLPREQHEWIQSAMGNFSKRFPQLFVAVYTGDLGEVSNLRQFGFWLLNRSAFDDVPVEMPNAAGILLTIDPESKAAGMVFGYLLEPYLTEQDTFECLSRAHGHWLEGRYADGILRVLRHLEAILIRRSRHARRRPDHYQRQLGRVSRDEVKPLRGKSIGKSAKDDQEVAP